ncbi:hypothetical protein BSKO_04785 [Bryopsis sp. KO-2023]|nr:hypothetical protein BSKO_04785 [Bryopsis sp. KO-2023]
MEGLGPSPPDSAPEQAKAVCVGGQSTKRGSFTEDELLQELRETKVLVFVRWMLACPVIAMILAALAPTALIAIAITKSVRIDSSIESFRIRDHPVAENEDSLLGGISMTKDFWDSEESEVATNRRRILSDLHSIDTSNEFPTKPCDGQETGRSCGAAVKRRSLLEDEKPRRRQSKWRIHVVYSMRDGSTVWTPDAMVWIKEFEKRITSHPDYHKLCVHLWKFEGARECRPPNSVINYIFPSVTHTDEGVDVIYDGRGETMGSLFNLGSQLALRGHLWYVDGGADLTGGIANSLRTDFLFGVPVDGYESQSDQIEAQEAVYRQFVVEMYAILKHASDDFMVVNYGGAYLTDHEIKQELFKDTKKILWGLVAIMLFAWWHTQSLFIAFVGLVEIIASLPIAYFFHRVVFGIPTLNVIQFLGLFIILGIGIDDVFVFFDTYSETLPLYWEVHASIRLSHAYKRAGAAMAVTSFTSAIAFAANMISAIPAIRSFGTFLAVMVAVNYALVMTWFPACVAFWERYIVQQRIKRFRFDSICCKVLCGPTPSSKRRHPHIRAKTAKFWKMLAWVILKLRWILLILFLALSAAGLYGATLLKGSNSVPAIFPHHHNVQKFLDLWESQFLSSGSCDKCWRDFSNPISGDVSPEILASFSVIPSNTQFSTSSQTDPATPSQRGSDSGTPQTSPADSTSSQRTPSESTTRETPAPSPPPPLSLTVDLPAPPPPQAASLDIRTELSVLLKDALTVDIITSGSMSLSWTTLTPLTISAFVLEYKKAADSNWIEVYRGRDGQFEFLGLDPGTTYEFRLSGISGAVTVMEEPISATTFEIGAPSAPLFVAASAVTPKTVTIEWKAKTQQTVAVNGFEIRISPESDQASSVTYTFNSTEFSAILGPLESSTSYGISVAAYNTMGAGPPSSISVETQTSHLPPKGERGIQLPSVALRRNVTLSIMNSEGTEVLGTGQLLGRNESMSFIYIISTSLNSDQVFPEPESTQGNSEFVENLLSGVGKSISSIQMEENAGQMFAGFVEKNAFQQNPMVTVMVERSPQDHLQKFSSWVKNELVLAVEGEGWSEGREYRAILGIGNGARDAFFVGLADPAMFRGVALVNALKRFEDVPIAGDLDVYIYSSGVEQWFEKNGASCDELAALELNEMLGAKGTCNFFREKENNIQLLDAGVNAFSFLSLLFSLKQLEEKVQTPPIRANTVRVSLLWGIESVDQVAGDVDPFSMNTGDPIFDKNFDVMAEQSQEWILHICEALENRTDLIEEPERCFMKGFKEWLDKKREKKPDTTPSFPVSRDEMPKQLWLFVEKYKSTYKEDVGYVLNSNSTSESSAYPEPKWVRITAKAKVVNRASGAEGYREWLRWDEAVKELNVGAPAELGPARQTSTLWVRIWTEREVVQSTKWAIAIAGVCALLAIVVFTGNLCMALLALINLVCVISVMLGFFYLIGWEMGAIEAISVTILVGLSVDFALHISEAYLKSSADARRLRATEAIQRLGAPIFGAAITTILACLPLMMATILILKFFGIVVASSIALSILYGLGFLCPLLMLVGPDRQGCSGILPTKPRKIVDVVFGTVLRRASVLSSLALGSLAIFPSGRKIVLEQRWLAYITGFVLVLTLIMEIVKACGRRGADSVKPITEKSPLSTTEMMRNRRSRKDAGPADKDAQIESNYSMRGGEFMHSYSENMVFNTAAPETPTTPILGIEETSSKNIDDSIGAPHPKATDEKNLDTLEEIRTHSIARMEP